MNEAGNILREVVTYHELLWALTWRDIRVKYKQAVMGILWVFFMPTMAVAAGVIVQAAVAFLSHAPFTLGQVGSVLVRTIAWSLFTGVLSSTAFSILSGMPLAAKIYFPRQIIPLSAMLGTLFDLAISGVVVALLLLLTPGSPLVRSWWLLLIPPLLLVLLMQALGLGLLFGSANMFFRDVKYILSTLLQFGVYFTPVLLFLGQLPAKVAACEVWNPVAPVLEAIASIALKGRVLPVALHVGERTTYLNLWPLLGYSAAAGVLFLAAGVLVFRRSEHLFTEVM
jgi:ABC-type polysaccharide/polyol phosphate export permease